MRISVIICMLNLIVLGIFGGIYAFTNIDVLLLLCIGNPTVARSFFAVCSVSSLFLIYALIFLKPFGRIK